MEEGQALDNGECTKLDGGRGRKEGKKGRKEDEVTAIRNGGDNLGAETLSDAPALVSSFSHIRKQGGCGGKEGGREGGRE